MHDPQKTVSQEFPIAPGPFEGTWESLRRFECPLWFRDAKFAIWSHWGPQSVPMYGDWYARQMYMEGSDQYRHHWRMYGHPSQRGYKDIVDLWKAERFDPKGLMDLFVAAGAKYFLSQAMHHDNFDNFDSQYQPWNSINHGPKRDIVSMWHHEARERGLPFGISEHLGASFNWFAVNKGADKRGPYAGIPYEGADPAHAALYYNNAGYSLEQSWYTDNAAFQAHWFERIKDAIDKTQPDLLYTDGAVPFGQIGLQAVAHLYNRSAQHHGGNNIAVYTQKDTDPSVSAIGVLDIERGQTESIAEQPWQCDTSIGDWFYNVKDNYKPAEQILGMLVDICSKNGNLALNVPQRPDGTIDEECEFILREMADWMKEQGEGIFGSRPWDRSGEGETGAKTGAFQESAVEWTSSDFRFTRKGDILYAYQMHPSEDGAAKISSLASGQARRVVAARALGQGPIRYVQDREGLQLAANPPANPRAPRGFEVSFE